jgi:hypothetical protein
MSDRPILTPLEASRAAQALGFALAGEADGMPADFHETGPAAQGKLNQVPRGGAMIAFSGKEMELLWLALSNGMGDDAILNLGLTKFERHILSNAANRIGNAGNLKGPRFSG